jgi:hypothetical protein
MGSQLLRIHLIAAVCHLLASNRIGLPDPPESLNPHPPLRCDAPPYGFPAHRVSSGSSADPPPIFSLSPLQRRFADATRETLNLRPLPDPPTKEGAILLCGRLPLQMSGAISRGPSLGRPRRLGVLQSLWYPPCSVIRGPQ